MSALTDYSENLVLDWLMNTNSVTRPTAWYVGLFTAEPGEAGGGTEVSTGSYARQAVTFGSSSGGQVQNTNTVTFTASGAAYGTVGFVALFDAVSGGNMLWYGSLLSAVVLDDRDSLVFSTGEITLSMD